MQTVLIIGAGESGKAVAQKLDRKKLKIIGFIDDQKLSKVVKITDDLSLPYLGDSTQLSKIATKHKPNTVVIAIQNANRSLLEKILYAVNTRHCKLLITPAFGEKDFFPAFPSATPSKPSTLGAVRRLRAEDLIGRRKLHFDGKLVAQKLTGKTVLITGAGGSIGSVLCLQLLLFPIKKIVALSRSEYSIFCLKEKVEVSPQHRQGNGVKIRYYIGDAADRQRMEEVFSLEKPDVIFHAAAHKHVPLMEDHPKEAFKNNVKATHTLLLASQKYRISDFVFISTDKAVNPSTVMGKSKRVAELLVSDFDDQGAVSCRTVRFGNVISSRGSVIPLFRRQIKKRLPITITHKKCKRFFMTRGEAAQLVIHAYALPRNRKNRLDHGSTETGQKMDNTFMLDMGSPVLIEKLVKMMLRLHGYVGKYERKIKTIGLRPGEKLDEDLLGKNETALPTQCANIFNIQTAPANSIFKAKLSKCENRLKEMTDQEMRLAFDQLLQ